jgi:hypothetical protein
MTSALVGLVVLYCTVLFAGKHVRRPGLWGTLFLALIAAIQVAVVLFYMFNAQAPPTN